MIIPTVTPLALQAELKSDSPPTLVDVRESEELQISRFPSATHIPMGEIPGRVEELAEDGDLVIVCRSGARSGQVAAYLLSLGFTQVRNLETGINGWARTVDPSLPLY